MQLSVIVPVYNMGAGGKLRYCMDSLLGQTFSDMEIIGVDDASTDDSLVILREYERDFPGKVRVVASPVNRRQGGAKNLGLQAASGDWIGFVDSDDWIAPAMYEQMCGAAIKYDADVVCCNYTAVTSKEHIERRDVCSPGFYDRSGLEEKIFPTMLFSGDFFHFGVSPSLCNKLFRASLFEKHLFRVPLSLKLGEDGLAVYPCLLEASCACFLEESFYYYRSSGGSLTHTMDRGRLAENRLLFDTYDQLIDLTMHPCMEKQLLYYYAYQCLLTLPPVFRAKQASGQNDRKAFLAECSYPPIRRAFRVVKSGCVSGLHNKAYVFCLRYGLYGPFRFFLTH